MLSWVLWLLLCLVIIYNMYAGKYFPTVPLPQIFSVLTKPFSVQTHILLAKVLWAHDFHEGAMRELFLAQDVAGGPTVLGATDEVSALLTNWREKPGKIRQLYEFWKTVAQSKPDYRDGFVMAGMYAYMLNDATAAKRFFEKALSLDPGNRTALDMLKSVK